MRIEIEQEDDGRWIAEAPDLPGVMAYGDTRADAVSKVEALALRVMAERLEQGDRAPQLDALLRGVSVWPSVKAKRLLAALLRIGWTVERQTSSHKTLARAGWAHVVFAFHDSEEIGPKMVARVAKQTGLKPGDL